MSLPVVTFILPGYTIDLGSRPENISFQNEVERQPWQSSLATIAGIDTHMGRQIPGARLALSDELVRTFGLDYNAPMVRADPIALKADRDSATLVPAELLDIQEEEANELIAALNEFTGEDELRFFRASNQAWYMMGMPADSLLTYPPLFLANRNVSMFLPDGQEAAPWRRLMTEIQMLLHTHPINRQRELRGQLPINSVWFWGGSALPETCADLANVQVYADEQQARVWAEALGFSTLGLGQFTPSLHCVERKAHSVALDLSLLSAWLEQDADKLEQELQRVNQQWLEPLVTQVGKRRISRIELLTEDALYGLCSVDTLNIATRGPSALYKRLTALFSR